MPTGVRKVMQQKFKHQYRIFFLICLYRVAYITKERGSQNWHYKDLKAKFKYEKFWDRHLHI